MKQVFNPQSNEKFEMQDFLNLSTSKQQAQIQRLDNSELLVQILRTEYIEPTHTLELMLNRLQELKESSVSTVVDALIRKAIERGNIEHTRLLLPFHTYNPKSDLYHCVKNQQFEIFDLLLANTQLDKQNMIDQVLADVCLSDGGDALKAVDLLMERGANPSAFNLKALGHAIHSQNLLMIDKLIPLSDIKNFGNSALSSAARYNLSDVVQRLLEGGAPYNEENSKPLRTAVRYNSGGVVECLLHWDKTFETVMEDALCSPGVEMSILELLWERCDIEAVRSQLHNFTDEGRERFDVLYAHHQQKILNQTVENLGTTGRGRKI